MCHNSGERRTVVQEIYAAQIILKFDWLTNCEREGDSAEVPYLLDSRIVLLIFIFPPLLKICVILLQA